MREGPLKITELVRPHAKALGLGLLAAVGVGVASLLEPWPLKIILDNVLRGKHSHGWLFRFVSYFAGTDRMAILEFAVGAVVLIAVLDAVCSYAQKYFTTTVGQWVTHDLRRTLYAHIQRLSLSFHNQKQTGDLISRVTSDIDAIQTFIASGLLGSLINCITLAGMVIVMFYMSWRFTLIALSVAPPLFFIVFTYTRRIKKAAREVRKKEGEIVSIVQEVFSSMRLVKAFAREDYEQRRLEEESLESVEIALRARSLKAKLTPLVEIIVATGTCLVLWFGSKMVLSGALSVGTLIVFIMYLNKMYKPMQALSKMTDVYSKASVGYERIQEVLATEDQVRDVRGARKAPRFKGKIEFDRVDFSYEPGTPVLKDIHLTIEPGQVAALVGPTGAGKTSIVSLIARFYDPDAGMVRIDGTDIRRFHKKSLRGQISFVLQETLLFRVPVWQNIAYGKPEATRGEILRAAQLANAHEFIEKLPDGYNTMVGERGVTLSGGEAQRMAIARAIIRNTPILILDEPSSHLDAASEELVLEALDRLMGGRTSIVIAHRLSTIQRADMIFVVQDGRIEERGKHEDLLESCGIYANLHRIQFQMEPESEGLHPLRKIPVQNPA